MKNSIKRVLSLVLTLAMILSLGVLPASAAGLGEGELVVTEPDREIDAVNYPAQQFSYYEPNGLSIDVKATAGALPRGTTMEVSRLEDLSRVQSAVDRAEDLEGTVALAADISFWNEDEEVEPLEGSKILVTMTAPEIAEILDPVVVHVPDEEPAVAERIEPLPEDEEALRMGDQVAFEAENFSVYAVIDGGEQSNITLTVEFYDRGELINKQVVRKDQIDRMDAPIFDPGVPSITDQESFEGWYLGETANYTESSVGYDVDTLNAYIKDTYTDMTSSATIKLHAMVYNVRYAIYHDQAGAVLKTQSFHVPATGNPTAQVTISMPYVGFMDGQNFVGWILEEYVEGKGDYPLYADEVGQVYKNDTTYTLTDTVQLYPYLRTGNWMIFDNYIDQDPDSTTASYTSPVFINEGDVTVAPATPTRTGYEFKGWYKEKSFTNRFIFGSTISEDTTVYAKWEPKTTTYTVVFWQQNVTDAVDAEDSAKTYSFYKSVERGATTGDSVSLILENSGTAADNRLGGNDANSIGEMGFYFQYNEANSDTSAKVVKGDGSTVLNVYYDRKVITFNFYGDLTNYSYSSSTYNSNYVYYGLSSGSYFRVYRSGSSWYDASNNRYTGTVYHLTFDSSSSRANTAELQFGSIQGLWFSSTDYYNWSVGSAISGRDWPYPGSNLMWHYEGNTTYTGKYYQFETGDQTTATTLNFFLNEYATSTTTRPYSCVGQDSDGNFTVALDDESLKSNETVIFHGDEFFGYRLERYNVTSNNYNNATVWDGKEVRVSYSDIGSSGHAYFYFARNQWDFVYSSNNSSVKTVTKYWEASLSDLASYVPDNGPAGYYFDGWYADPAFDTPFDFSQEMPNHSVEIYAKWTMMRFRIVLDPTGGEAGVEPSDITFPGNQATTFRVDYGELVQASSINNATREGYTLLGWYLDKDFTIPYNFANPVTDQTQNVDMSYATASDAERQGVDPWTLENGEPKPYTDVGRPNVRGKLTIYAKWRQDPNGIIGINVRYLADDKDGNTGKFSDGTNIWDDPDIYADRAQAYAQPASTPDNNELQFLYWEILGRDGNPTGRKAYPGQIWEVLYDDAVSEEIGSGDDGDMIPVDVYYTYGDRGRFRSADSVLASGSRETTTLTTTLFSDNFDSNTAFTTSTSSTDSMSTETWTAYNPGSGNNWTLGTDYAHSGNYQAQVQYNSSNAANCYLISHPFKVSGSASDLTVSLFERVRSDRYAETFEVFLIVTDGITTNGDAVNATHYNVLSSASYTNTTYAEKTASVSNLSALAGKNVRLVIHCTSARDMYYLYIDDINVTETKTGEAVTYELVDEPVAGKDYVIVVGGTHAVTNSTYSNNRYINALSVVNNGDGTITFFANEESSLLYRVGGSASGWTFYSQAAGKYLGLNASDSHWLSMTADPWEWLYTGTDLDNQWTGEDNVNSNGDAWRYLGYSAAYDDFTTMITTGQDVKFYKAVTNGYTVTFVDGRTNEVIETQQVDEGESAVAPTPPDHSDDGWIFSGWDTPFDNVTEDITVTAQYVNQSSLSYTVTFRFMDSNGNWVTESQTVQHGRAATPPTVPTPPAGYEFNSWDKHFTSITSNMTINAVYKQTATMKYVVTLRAVYGRATTTAKTHIYWYANDGTETNNGAGPRQEDLNLDLNVPTSIPTPTTFRYTENRAEKTGLVYEGHVFLGWARLENNSASGTASAAHPELTEDDLYLKWVADSSESGGGHFEAKAPKYYLVGFIDGRDYEGHDYPLRNGKLVMTTTSAAYVAVAPIDATPNSTEDWYMTDGWLGENVTSCTLRQNVGSNANKLYVPANTTVTFTLVENSDGSLTLSYTTAAAEPDGIVLPKASGDEETMTEWTRVTQVAADEEHPYHDMYAVWAGVFYVYHSGTNKVERIMYTTPINSFDLTALVDTDHYLYGGYYKEYGGASSTFVENHEALNFSEVASVTGYHDVAQINTIAAKGYVSTAVDNGTGVAPYTGQANAWVWDTENAETNRAYTVAGNSITPVAGTVYYIKEVPADSFLQPRLRYTYVAATGEIGTSWLITNMDDTNYKDVGFMVGSTKVVGDKVDSITITALTTGTTETYAVSDIFPGGAKMSYKMVYNNPDLYPEGYTDGDEACSTLTDGARVHMFWVTPDGMMVTSTAVRTYNNVTVANGYSGGLTAPKSTQTSSITLYQAS